MKPAPFDWSGLVGEQAEARGTLYTAREILQQPRVWLDTFERVRRSRTELAALLRSAGLEGGPATGVVLIGAGSSDFIGQLVAPAFRTRFRCTAEVLPSTDLLTQTASLLLPERQYLFVWFSRSGTTPEALELLNRLERDFPSAHHLFVTCNARGAFARRQRAQSTCLTLDDAVNDRGLAMTSSFTCMALAGLLIGHGLELDQLSAGVSDLARAGRQLLDQSTEALRDLALSKNSFACFLGSGSLRAVAGEAALKLLELSAGRVKTRFDSFLGVRHGPLASLDQHSLLVGFLSTVRAERSYELELIEEVRRKSLARAVALVAPEPDARANELADLYIELELGVPAPLRPLLDVVVGQVLALFSSLAHGLPPDSPSPNGAIQRVVTHIRPADGGAEVNAR